jgi:hypothetical protein
VPAVFCALLITACGQDTDTAFKTEPGPHSPVVASPVALEYPDLEKDLMLRITFPDSPGEYPVIIFSHGGRCSRDKYTDFAGHWASHGYVVIQPAHLDSSSLRRAKALGGTQLMAEADRTRRLDMVHILDSLERIQDLVPGLAGKIDKERIVAAGHSLGGGTALTVTGLVLVNPRDGATMGFVDDRFDALLLISDPGNSPLMPTDPWRAVALPTFIATGTDDFSGIARRIKSGFSYEFSADVNFADTPNHYLFIDGMDHYLGGLICKDDAPGEPDYEALRIINGASTAFLDAYLKDNTVALAALSANRMPESAGPRPTIGLR